jgi:predicted dehydrogenase
VFHNRRWDSDFLTVKSLINEGLLGEVATLNRISTAIVQVRNAGANRAAGKRNLVRSGAASADQASICLACR